MPAPTSESLAVPADPQKVHDDVRRWLTDNWDADLSLGEWRRRLTHSGWAAPTWPQKWHGLGLPAWASEIVSAELANVSAVGPALGVGVGLAGPTILEHGPDALRARFLEPLLTGEESWCQLFSEPGAGSDLAGITTTARLDGDEWIVNGQKVWNTSAHHADFGVLLARTDWDVPKHHGLTFLILPMHQPGVEVRPLRQMNGYNSFNEVFITDARIPADYVVGDVGKGWAVALTTLAFERRFGGLDRPKYPDSGRRAHTEAATEAEQYFETYQWYPQRAGRLDLVIEQARAAGLQNDPTLRQEIARVLSLDLVSNWTAQRALAARALGRAPGSEGSIGKLASSEIARQAGRVHSLIAGAWGMLAGQGSQLDGIISEILISVPAQSIAGGTDEIQKNILAEKVLGLPRDISTDRDVAFRSVPRNA